VISTAPQLRKAGDRIFTKDETVRVLHGSFAGRCGVVLALVGNEESLLLEIQVQGEPDTTLHQTSALSRVYDDHARTGSRPSCR